MWAALGLLTAVLIAAMLLMQERLKVEGFALAFWCKVAAVFVTLPFVILYGLPSDWRFYAWLLPQAASYVVADVVLFRSLPVIGAGVVSRLLPSTVVASFFLWFAVAPSDLRPYAAQPVIGALTCLVLAGAAFFASRLRECAVSVQAVRVLWPVLLANTLSPVLTKITTQYADPRQGAFGFTFVEALMMLAMWLAWLVLARPVPWKDMVERKTLKKSLCVGVVTSMMVVIIVTSYYFIDNPGYVCALQLLYAVIVLAVHRITGKKDDSDVRSGLGMVICAGLLILLKTKFG